MDLGSSLGGMENLEQDNRLSEKGCPVALRLPAFYTGCEKNLESFFVR